MYHCICHFLAVRIPDMQLILSEPQVPHLLDGQSHSPYLIRLLQELSELVIFIC